MIVCVSTLRRRRQIVVDWLIENGATIDQEGNPVTIWAEVPPELTLYKILCHEWVVDVIKSNCKEITPC
jgi:hypothetical protein